MLINILIFSLPTFLPHFQILQSIVLCDRDLRALVCWSPPLFLVPPHTRLRLWECELCKAVANTASFGEGCFYIASQGRADRKPPSTHAFCLETQIRLYFACKVGAIAQQKYGSSQRRNALLASQSIISCGKSLSPLRKAILRAGMRGCLAGHTLQQVERDSLESNQKVYRVCGFLWINRGCCKLSRWPLRHHSSPFPELLSVYWWRSLADQLVSTPRHGLTPLPALRSPLVTEYCLGQGLAF